MLIDEVLVDEELPHLKSHFTRGRRRSTRHRHRGRSSLQSSRPVSSIPACVLLDGSSLPVVTLQRRKQGSLSLIHGVRPRFEEQMLVSYPCLTTACVIGQRSNPVQKWRRTL